MEFECEFCHQNFESNKIAIEHLKKVHNVKEKVDLIKCTVKNPNCDRHFQTFNGLTRHISKCVGMNIDRIGNDLSGDDTLKSTNQECERSFVFNESKEEENFTSEIDTVPESILNQTFVFDESVETDCSRRKSPGHSFSFNCSDIEATSTTVDTITKCFLVDLLKLNLNEQTTNEIFRLTNTLLKNCREMCQRSMEVSSTVSPQEAFDHSMDALMNEFQRFDSSHKRRKFVESQSSFVKSNSIGIGTHWETKRDKHSNTLLPLRKQSEFCFFSPLDIIKTLFEKPHIYDTYYEYNKKSKHICDPQTYKDFCCGNVAKNVDFFKQNPNGLQLQFFVDGFEVCSALKSKTTLHSQVAVYMTIQNMPPRFAYNMSSIFLVCLVNENDLKKK